MESILARALESTLKYWLRSFSRDQFKLQGRTVQLSNLDIDGDALHSSVGLPPALNVASAKVRKLVIVLPSVSNVQIEPVVVQIDRLDLVLEENSDPKSCSSSSCSQSNASGLSGGKSSGYGFADKIADGMTLEVQTVNLMLETRGGARSKGGSTWTPPMASITIRNLLLYTTNENWEVVNLKEARDFSTNKQFIYVFKKLEWETLSIDLLPHPDMFLDARLSHAQGLSKRDADGAKRVFFGGERFLEGISGQAYITVKRTGLNDPLGLEVRLHITEAVCPAFSEPGLRALLRFLTGLYVCLNRGDVDPKSLQQSTEAAGCSMVSVIVDHIFFCVRDAEFRLDLLMQSLHLSRASIFDGENSQNLTQITIGGFFLRDTFSRPPCALIQPSMHVISEGSNTIPDFARDFCPPIYPLGDQQWQPNRGVPFISIHSLQVKPSPSPPVIASETVVHCQPLLIHLQEESCLRLSSLLADGIVVSPGVVLPDFSIKSLKFSLKELDLTVPLSSKMLTTTPAESACTSDKSSFAGARLHIENLFVFESPFLNLTLLGLEKDPACFCFWKNQPVDAGQKKWTAGASYLGLSLETVDDIAGLQSSLDWPLRWKCVEVRDACIEVAMATPDGSPLTSVPPPGGVVRVGIACEQYLSNTSVEQLFFVLELYAYLGNVSEKIAIAGKSSRLQSIKRSESWSDNLMSKFPSDTAIRLVVRDLRLRFLEDSCKTIEGRPLVQFVGEDLCIRVSHITLGGAISVSSSIWWEKIEVDCVDADRNIPHDDDLIVMSSSDGNSMTANGHPELRAVLWVQQEQRERSTKAKGVPFLEVNVVNVIPLDVKDAECHSLRVTACIAGVRLGGGMRYTESLLLRFGVLGPDGRLGNELSRGLENLSSGPLSKIFKASPLNVNSIKENGTSGHTQDNLFSHLGTPDDVDVSVVFRDWLFALEGAEEMVEEHAIDLLSREERCWHATFKSLQVKAKNSPKGLINGSMKSHGSPHYPVDSIVIGIEGLETLKPQVQTGSSKEEFPVNGFEQKALGGVNVEVRMAISEYDTHDEIGKWTMENLKLSVHRPIEAVITKDELQHLTALCKSELDSMGRITAGVLRLLKLEGSFGQAAIDQLSNLGSEGLDRILTPKKLNNGSSGSVSNLQVTPSTNGIVKSLPASPISDLVASLVDEVRDSQAKCDTLISDLGKLHSSTHHVESARLLAEKLASMESLLSQLRTQS